MQLPDYSAKETLRAKLMQACRSHRSQYIAAEVLAPEPCFCVACRTAQWPEVERSTHPADATRTYEKVPLECWDTRVHVPVPGTYTVLYD